MMTATQSFIQIDNLSNELAEKVAHITAVPTNHTEAFRYLPLAFLKNAFQLPANPFKVSETRKRVAAFLDQDAIIVEAGQLKSGLADLRTQHEYSSNPLIQLNQVLSTGTIQVRIQDEKPLHIVLDHGQSEFVISSPNLSITVPKGQRSTAVIWNLGSEKELGFQNTVLNVLLEEGSQLDLITIDLGSSAHHLITHADYQIAKTAKLTIFQIGLEGQLSQNFAMIRANSTAQLGHFSAALLSGNQFWGIQSAIHLEAACRSKQLCKTVLFDKAVSDFNGLIYVHPKAQKVESSQLNQNILVSDHARVYSRPQLQIYADDVVCTHGSTSSDLNAEDRFYLKSRGIDEAMANRILVKGFLEEVIDQIEYLDLQAFLMDYLIEKIDEGCIFE